MFNLQVAFYGFRQQDVIFATGLLGTVYCCAVHSKYINNLLSLVYINDLFA